MNSSKSKSPWSQEDRDASGDLNAFVEEVKGLSKGHSYDKRSIEPTSNSSIDEESGLENWPTEEELMEWRSPRKHPYSRSDDSHYV